jgi:hypothetical protein
VDGALPPRRRARAADVDGGVHVSGDKTAIVAFAAFGIGSQVVLVGFFAARRWAPGLAERFGWIAYAVAALGLPLGGWLLAAGQSWRFWTGPVLLAVWAALGVTVDLWRRIEWRDPIRWNVFVPYVVLYFFAQMFLWWPLWDVERVAWACFLVLFAVSTALNLRGHFGEGASPTVR